MALSSTLNAVLYLHLTKSFPISQSRLPFQGWFCIDDLSEFFQAVGITVLRRVDFSRVSCSIPFFLLHEFRRAEQSLSLKG